MKEDTFYVIAIEVSSALPIGFLRVHARVMAAKLSTAGFDLQRLWSQVVHRPNCSSRRQFVPKSGQHNVILGQRLILHAPRPFSYHMLLSHLLPPPTIVAPVTLDISGINRGDIPRAAVLLSTYWFSALHKSRRPRRPDLFRIPCQPLRQLYPGPPGEPQGCIGRAD